jgi:hypothetical protein
MSVHFEQPKKASPVAEYRNLKVWQESKRYGDIVGQGKEGKDGSEKNG